jgi:hypothetical protein
LSRQTVQRHLKDFEGAGLAVRSKVVKGMEQTTAQLQTHTLKLVRAVSKGLGEKSEWFFGSLVGFSIFLFWVL